MSPRDLVYVGHMLDMARKVVSQDGRHLTRRLRRRREPQGSRSRESSAMHIRKSRGPTSSECATHWVRIEDVGDTERLRSTVRALRSKRVGADGRGKAERERFHSGEEELELAFRNLDVPGGTVVEVVVATFLAGSITVEHGRGKLLLRSRDGVTVPVVKGRRDRDSSRRDTVSARHVQRRLRTVDDTLAHSCIRTRTIAGGRRRGSNKRSVLSKRWCYKRRH
jgi:hypothetical protein